MEAYLLEDSTLRILQSFIRKKTIKNSIFSLLLVNFIAFAQISEVIQSDYNTFTEYTNVSNQK